MSDSWIWPNTSCWNYWLLVSSVYCCTYYFCWIWSTDQFFLPGDTLLFSTGFLAYGGILDFNIHLLVLILFIAAVLGDNVGYLFDRRIGRRIFKSRFNIFPARKHANSWNFLRKHGGKTIIIARFVPIVRTFAPIVAGVGKMNYKTFLSSI